MKTVNQTISLIQVGMVESVTKSFSSDDIKIFSRISGDLNPIHCDEEFIKNSRFKKIVCHGLLVNSLFSAIFGTKLPGNGSLFKNHKIRYLKPVYCDDLITATVAVKNVDVRKKIIFFDLSAFVKKKKVLDGEAEIFIS